MGGNKLGNGIDSRLNLGSLHVSCQQPCHSSDSHLVSNQNLNKTQHSHVIYIVKAEIGSGKVHGAEKVQKTKKQSEVVKGPKG